MTDTLSEHADPTLHKGEPLIEMTDVGKTYGAIRALKGINLTVNAGEVTCVLGDNGAGKSTLIKIMSGLHAHTEGTLKVDGKEVNFGSPRESLDHGIATVYQDLAVVGADGGVAELLPRLGAARRELPAGADEDQGDAGDRRRRAEEDGHHGQGHQPAHRHPVRWSAAVRGHRPGGLLRCPGADPGRADRRARRQAVRCGAQVHRRRPRRRPRASCSSPTTRTTPTWSATTSSSSSSASAVLDKKRSEVTLEELTAEMAGGRELAELSHELQGR